MTEIFDLDYNAGAPLDSRVREAMDSLPDVADANPHSPHQRGRAAAGILERARERIAAVLSVGADEVVFTSGGTESNNLAVCSGAAIATQAGRPFAASVLEHPSITMAVEAFVPAEYRMALPVDSSGVVDVAWLQRAEPAFATVILAHHELGVVQDLVTLAAELHACGGVLHSDASQAVGRIPVAEALAVCDYATLSPHKCGGPRGIGIWIVRKGRFAAQLLRGGAQELGRRAGTPSPRLAHGAAEALCLALAERDARATRMQAALDALLVPVERAGLRVLCADAGQAMLPNTRTLCMPDVDARHAVPALDLAGILVSYGSACTSGAREPARSILALGTPRPIAARCLRISLPENMTVKNARTAGALLCQAVGRISRCRRTNRL